MTEEIIIDGVNVAGCKNYVHIEKERYAPKCNCRLTTVERGYYCDTYATSVCEEEDCEYKQLKRLEQERDELKQENKRLKENKIRELDRALDAENKYKSALEEIRELIIPLKSYDLVEKALDKINEVLG